MTALVCSAKILPMAVAMSVAYLSTTFVSRHFYPDHGSHCRIATVIFAVAPVAMWSVLGAAIGFGVITWLLPRCLLWWPDAHVELRSKDDLLAWVRTQFLSGGSRQWKGKLETYLGKNVVAK